MSNKSASTDDAGCDLKPVLQVEPNTLSRIFGAASASKHDVPHSVQTCFNPCLFLDDKLCRYGPTCRLLAYLPQRVEISFLLWDLGGNAEQLPCPRLSYRELS